MTGGNHGAIFGQNAALSAKRRLGPPLAGPRTEAAMDNESTLDTLTPRLDRLERENRLLKIGGAILLLGLAAVGAMGQVLPKAIPKVVEAEQFVLRDTKGKIRAGLEVRAAGAPGLVLYDQNGKARAALNVLADGSPGLVLADQTENPRAILTLPADDGAPRLHLSDRNGKIRAMLNVDTRGPSLTLWDQNGNIRASLDIDTSGPSLALWDENRERAVLGHTALEGKATGTVEQRPASSLVLFDSRDGKVLWRVP